MKLAIKIETILKIVLFVVASDQGNLLLRNSLINPFPTPIRNEYMAEISRVSIKFRTFLSSVKKRKKKMAVPNDIHSNMIKLLRFMSNFPGSKLADIKGIKNYFLLNGLFWRLNGIKKPPVNSEGLVYIMIFILPAD